MSKPVLNLKRTYIQMRKMLDDRLSEYNLTTSQFEVLGHVSHAGEMEQQQLQRCSGITSATLTGILDRLEERNLLERKPGMTDGRAKIVAITPAGGELATKLVDLMHQFEDDMLTGFSTAERALLADWLQRIAENLGDTTFGECD